MIKFSLIFIVHVLVPKTCLLLREQKKNHLDDRDKNYKDNAANIYQWTLYAVDGWMDGWIINFFSLTGKFIYNLKKKYIHL